MESCTRDVFEDNLTFESNQALTIIKSIASATKHLHDKGILHGDLYTHNTLYSEDGFSYLGDFGAASFYDKNHSSAEILERLDIRAFGCFMEDILTRTVSLNESATAKLSSLMQSCFEIDSNKRPDFKTVVEQLEEIVL